jgi:hypothetical protein
MNQHSAVKQSAVSNQQSAISNLIHNWQYPSVHVLV